MMKLGCRIVKRWLSGSQGRQFASEDALEGASCNRHQRHQHRYDRSAELSCGPENAEGTSHSQTLHVTGESARVTRKDSAHIMKSGCADASRMLKLSRILRGDTTLMERRLRVPRRLVIRDDCITK